MAISARKMGRIRPIGIFDTGQFRVVVLKGGRVKVVPKLGHYRNNRLKATVTVPAVVTTNWLAKMLAAVAEMYGNATQGDCVIASLLKVFGGWTGNELGKPVLSSDSEALATYVKVCGPGDQGCVITDVLDWAKATGIPMGGMLHKIGGYVSIDHTNQQEVQVATQVFGPATKLGVNLPTTWYNSATANGFVWGVPPANDTIAGGHDVPIIDVTAQGVVIATWAMWGVITWPALMSGVVTGQPVVDEAYCSLGPDWDSLAGLAPNGIDAATLAADLVLLGQGTIPPVSPTPPPALTLTLSGPLAAGAWKLSQ